RTWSALAQRLGIENTPKLLVGIGVGGLLVFSFLSAVLSIGLPNPVSLTVQKSTESTKVLDRNGIVLYDIYNERRRTLVSFDDMPEYLKQATIATEDNDFYKHSGFDIRGLIRGVILKPLSGQRAQGGSTITQQFVKNSFLTSSRSITRKIKELILAIEIEHLYTKDKILELYLNSMPYGSAYYGVESAAQGYYGKPASDLTLAESATLAALLQAPSYYSPYGSDYVTRLLPRKDWVLERMFKEGYITDKQMKEAQTEELAFLPRRDSIRAPHFVMYVKELLADKYGEKMLEEGGLTITTTLDWEKQQIAEDVITARAANNKEKYNASNASLVSIDPNTGEILAMVGSANYFDEEIDGYVNVAIRERQPGSAFKPIVYATAFLKGYSPATMLMDVHTDFGQGYDPYNYDNKFRGPVSIRTALQGSLNVPAAKVLAYAGVNESINLAHKMGITTMTEPERYGLSLVLGGAEVKLLDLTSAYGVFAAGGEKAKIMSVLKVADRKGRVLEEHKPESTKEVLDPEAAYLINNVLSDDAARAYAFGAGGYLTLPGRPAGAKTGTTQNYRDGWTFGYTPDLVTGVWVGNNDNTEMDHAAGYTVAAPIWNQYMRQATAKMPVRAFAVPEGIRSVSVDEVCGKLPTDATPSTKTEVFASWNAPRENDDIHKKVRVVKSNPDYLAPASWPEDQVDYKVFTELHSERPDNSSWENPVLKWAEENGYNDIPTMFYDGSISSSGEISIVFPTNGSRIDGNFVINVSVQDESNVKEVGFYYDGNLVRKSVKGPWTASVTAGVVLDGKNHTVTARLFKNSGGTVETSVSVIAGQAQSEYMTMDNVTQNFFPIDLTAKLNDKGKALNIEKIEIYLDNQLQESFLANLSGSYTARVEDGVKGQHTAYAKIYIKAGANYTSNTINFETR
ncbi:penicillin-binding protein, partial [Patescibacteria group bacterium]|nr:penicillin-binding protein [Patescibacteria group bacterium]